MTETSYHVRRAIEGEVRSLEWIVERFHPFLVAQARLRLGPEFDRSDSEDIAQDVWRVVLHRIHDLRPRDGRWAPVLVRFLGQTVLNLCNQRLRERIRDRTIPIDTDGDGYSAQRSNDALSVMSRGVITRIVRSELMQRIRNCMEKLTVRGRDVLVLRLLEHRTNREIADILCIEPNTVAVRYRRALASLRQCLPGDSFSEVWKARR